MTVANSTAGSTLAAQLRREENNGANSLHCSRRARCRFCQKLNSNLTDYGISTFFFEMDAKPGQKLHRMMRVGVNKYDRIILICSKDSLNRPGVLNEIEEALQREAREGGSERIIPIRLDDYVLSGWAPPNEDVAQAIRDRVVADFAKTHTNDGKFNVAFLNVLNALGSIDDVKYKKFDSEIEILDTRGKKMRWVVERTLRPLIPGVTELSPREILASGPVRLVEVNYGEMVPVTIGGVVMHKAVFPIPLPQGIDFKHRLVIEEEDSFLTDEEDFVFRDRCFFNELDFKIKLPLSRPAIEAAATKSIGGHIYPAAVFSTDASRCNLRLKIDQPEIGAAYRIYWKW